MSCRGLTLGVKSCVCQEVWIFSCFFSTMKTDEVDQNPVPEEKSQEEEKLFNLESKFKIPHHI